MTTETLPPRTRPMDRRRNLAANKTAGRARRTAMGMPPPQVSPQDSSGNASTAVETKGAAVDEDQGASIVKAGRNRRVRAKMLLRMRSWEGRGDAAAVDKANIIMIECCFISCLSTFVVCDTSSYVDPTGNLKSV